MDKHVFIYLLIIYYACSNYQILAQNKNIVHKIGLDIRPAYVGQTSKFMRNHDDEDHLNLHKDISFHLKYGFQPNPESDQAQLYPYAYQGIGVAYNAFDAQHEIGHPWAIYAFQSSRIATLSSKLSFDYEWNFGASFGWHPYQQESNSKNKIVGSKINAYINVSFFLNAKLSNYCNFLAGIDLSHFSNGNTHLPNSGINTIGGRVGLIYTLNPQTDKSPQKYHKQIKELATASFGSRICYDIILYGATRTKGVYIGKDPYIFPGQFGILGININPMYKLNRFFKIGFSIDCQYDESANIYTKETTYNGDTEPQFYRPPLRKQIGTGLSLRGEFTMPFFTRHYID